MVEVYTSRTAYQGVDSLDITVKSGDGPGKCLAPTWDLVAGFKLFEAQQSRAQAQDVNNAKQLAEANSEIERWGKNKLTGEPLQPLDENTYTERYLDLLRKRYQADKQPFLDILTRESATLTCYCAPGVFCHRHLAVEVLDKVAQANQLPFKAGGERDPYTHRAYVPPEAPNFQTLGTTVLPIVDPKGKTQYGWSVTAILNGKDEEGAPKRQLLEVAHFAPPFQVSAERYAEQIIDDLKAQRLPLRGAAADVRDSIHHVQEVAKTNDLTGKVETLTSKQAEVWENDRKAFALAHTPKGMHIQPDLHELSFTALPVINEKRACVGFCAVAIVTQQDKQSLLEVAHFESTGRKRAEEYAQQLADDLKRAHLPRAGTTGQVDKSVGWLSEQAFNNHLNGVWLPLDAKAQERLATGRLQLEHEPFELRPLSQVRGREISR